MNIAITIGRSADHEQLAILAKVVEKFYPETLPSTVQEIFEHSFEDLINKFRDEDRRSTKDGVVKTICLCAQFSSLTQFSAVITRFMTLTDVSTQIELLLLLLHSLRQHEDREKMEFVFETTSEHMANFLLCEYDTANKVGLLLQKLLSGVNNADSLCSRLSTLLLNNWQQYSSARYMILCSNFELLLQHMSSNEWIWVWDVLCQVRNFL